MFNKVSGLLTKWHHNSKRHQLCPFNCCTVNKKQHVQKLQGLNASELTSRHTQHHIYQPGGDTIPDQDPNWVYQTGTDEG